MTDSSQEIKAFSPEQLKERVTENVRANFGMLIPDDQFQILVTKEINAFFEEETMTDWDSRTTYANYSHVNKESFKMKITPFRFMVWSAIREIVVKKLDEALASPEFSTYINYGQNLDGTSNMEYVLSDMLDKKLQEIAPKMAAAMFKNMFGDAVNAAKTELRNDIINNNY